MIIQKTLILGDDKCGFEFNKKETNDYACCNIFIRDGVVGIRDYIEYAGRSWSISDRVCAIHDQSGNRDEFCEPDTDCLLCAGCGTVFYQGEKPEMD